MEIAKDIEIVDLCLYLRKHRTLILADTHIGYEEALNKGGVLIPRFQFKETMERLRKIIGNVKDVDRIVINGDIKHEFGTISELEWRHTIRLLDFLEEKSKQIILIKGNHDTILGPIARKREVKVVPELKLQDILIVHGDKIVDEKDLKGIKTMIIGHEHPAVTVEDGVREEMYKCFLKGKFLGRELIVQPSFNLVTEGTDVIKEDLLSPFLKQDLSGFECYIVGDKVYSFGELRKFFKYT